MTSLVVVDDSQSTLLIFKRLYQDGSVKVYTAENAKSGLDVVRQIRPDVVILDVMLPDMSGLDMFERVRQIDPKLPVIFITASSSSETVIEAMKLGAYDYLSKPLNLGQVRDLVQRALELRRLMNVPVRVADAAPVVPADKVEATGDSLVGRCPAMQDVYKAIGLVAPQDVTVLVLGETGTGKELIARAIYQHGRRAGKPFLAINCAAIPETLLESELFGHERGAFTGADRRRIGKFEQAHGGTLFLDEIGDMTPLTQSKLLRVLQEQRFERLGGEETVHT
ncbi:MAG TPA: sigma-54 dependent transcriptional regulator, partial [Pirellulales bacterium]